MFCIRDPECRNENLDEFKLTDSLVFEAAGWE